jgi:membrane-bound lytic murein transglycosylase D
VSEQVNYLLMDRRATMMQWFDRMVVYGPMIRGVLSEEKVPSDLQYLPPLLSDMLPNAKTKTGGVGWWALGSTKEKKPSPGISWVVTNDWDDRRDPVLSTRIACTTLQGLLRKDRKTNWLLAICSFVDGADKVDPIVDKASGFSYWDLVMPPYSENLIPRLVALKIIDTHRAFYGLDTPPLPPLAVDYLDRVKLQKDLPLHVIARWCEINARQIWELNPGVDPSTGILAKPDKRSPSGFPLRVPKGMGQKVRQLLVREGYVQN